MLTGGVRTPSDALVGPVAVAALRSLHVDWLFLGVHGIDERAGFTTPNLVEAETNRALIAAARQVVVTADSTKWGVVGLCSMARLDDVDVVVTDDGLDAEARRLLGHGSGGSWWHAQPADSEVAPRTTRRRGPRSRWRARWTSRTADRRVITTTSPTGGSPAQRQPGWPTGGS